MVVLAELRGRASFLALEDAVYVGWVAVKFLGEPCFRTFRLIENFLYFVAYVNGVHNCLFCEPTPLIYMHKKSVKPFLFSLLCLFNSVVFPNTLYTNKHETAHAIQREPLARLFSCTLNWGIFQN